MASLGNTLIFVVVLREDLGRYIGANDAVSNNMYLNRKK
jgi:hypothetical protein